MIISEIIIIKKKIDYNTTHQTKIKKKIAVIFRFLTSLIGLFPVPYNLKFDKIKEERKRFKKDESCFS